MKKKLIVILSVIFVIVVMGIILFFLRNDKKDNIYTVDELKFKDEYENKNGYEIAENYVLKTINVNVDNNVKYVNNDELLDLLTNGTNIIYFGWSDCNWCRSIVPTLVDVVKEEEIDTLYYYDLKSLRNNYENNSDEELVKLYENIIKIIGEDIESVFDENSSRVGEKKILAPTVVFIKDGKYTGLHVKSVDSHINSTDELTKEQVIELKRIYKSYIDSIKPNLCYEEGC